MRLDVVCLDLGLGADSGLDLLAHFHAVDPQLPCVVVTAARQLEVAVAAMRAGAYDYVTKPLESGRTLLAVGRAKERRDLQQSVQRLENQIADRRLMGEVVSHSASMQEVEQQVERIVDRDVTLLLKGESGAGHDLVARAIHRGGARKAGPFVSVDAALLGQEESLSCLFGRELGDGTVSCGAFEQASGGSLFIDNIDRLPMSSQIRLVKILSEGSLCRVGSSEERKVNVRLIGASANSLKDLMAAGEYQERLYFRLTVCQIELPPLRGRKADIPYIVGYFLKILSDEEHLVRHVAPDALDLLMRYSWPGNLPQLRSIVHRALLATRGDTIEILDLPPELRGLPTNDNSHVTSTAGTIFSGDEVLPLREIERMAIAHALSVTGGSVGAAARRLGIGRATLYRRLASFESSQDVA